MASSIDENFIYLATGDLKQQLIAVVSNPPLPRWERLCSERLLKICLQFSKQTEPNGEVYHPENSTACDSFWEERWSLMLENFP